MGNYIMPPIGVAVSVATSMNLANNIPKNMYFSGAGNISGLSWSGRKKKLGLLSWKDQFAIIHGDGIYLDGKMLRGTAGIGADGRVWIFDSMDGGVGMNDFAGTMGEKIKGYVSDYRHYHKIRTTTPKKRIQPAAKTMDGAVNPDSMLERVPSEGMKKERQKEVQKVNSVEVLEKSSELVALAIDEI